jgi:hypothetical protein
VIKINSASNVLVFSHRHVRIYIRRSTGTIVFQNQLIILQALTNKAFLIITPRSDIQSLWYIINFVVESLVCVAVFKMVAREVIM